MNGGNSCMRLNQFEFLIALEEYGSFSKAAQVLFISQPSLSAAIKELETELGVPLLERSRKGVTFTEKGEQVLQEARKIEESVGRIKRIALQESSGFKGKLRVGGIPYFCDMLLMDTLMKLQQDYPELTIQLIEDDTDHILKLLAEEHLDLGLIMITFFDENDRKNEVRKIKMPYHKLFDDQMVFVARKNHPLCVQAQTIDHILEYPFITHRKTVNPVTQRLLNSDGENHKMTQISGFHNLKRYLISSDAVSVFPSKALALLLDGTEKLVTIPVKSFSWHCQIGWISQDKRLGVLEDAFVHALEKRCSIGF